MSSDHPGPEEALRQSERRFRLAIDRSTVVAFETDLEGRFTLAL